VPQAARLRPATAGIYALGQVASDLTWNMYTGFILYYYTNVVLLPIAAAGTVLLAGRVFDALVDPIIGVLVDRTRTRLGRARPWILASAVPFALITVLSFRVPAWSTPAKLLYAYITFTLAGVCYSLVYVPYNALMPLMSSDPVDKLRLGSLRAVGSSGGSIVIYGAMMAAVGLLGGGDAQRGFTLASGVVVLASTVMYLLVVAYCRERAPTAESSPAPSIGAGLRNLFRNPVWVIVALFALLMLVRLGVLVSATAYFAGEVLHHPDAIGWLLSSLSFSLLIGGLVARPWLKWMGKRRGNLIALAVSIAASLILAGMTHNIRGFHILYFLANITFGIQLTSIFVLSSDAVDAQERLFGSRDEGLQTSAISFAAKVGMALGGAITAYGLALAHFDPQAVTDPARARVALVYFLAPATLAALQMITISFYREE